MENKNTPPNIAAESPLDASTAQVDSFPLNLKKYHKPLLIIALLSLILFSAAVITFAFDPFHITKRNNSSNPQPLTNQEIIDLRITMSALANEYIGKSGEEFYNAMTAYIASAPTDEARDSFSRFFVYLALRHHFPEGAFYVYDEYLSAHPTLTDLEICELYDYRAIINYSYITNDDFYDKDTFEALRASSCAEAIRDYPKLDGESDFSYGKRLYYLGFLTDSLAYLESSYDSAPPDSQDSTLSSEKEAARRLLVAYYILAHDYPKIQKYSLSPSTGPEAKNCNETNNTGESSCDFE